MAKIPSPFKSLPAERRLALVLEALAKHKGAKTLYAQRIAAKGGGFRAATLVSWPAERIAKESLRLGALTPQDELELLQLLYVDLEPKYQITFLDTLGVAHDNGVIPEDLEAPYAPADAVVRGAEAVLSAHGDEGRHYLRTLVVYNLPAWPGLDTVVSAEG
ncbi:MAG TPA: hypothetical protein DGD08_02265 [Gemmatimonas aurantiaca]|uniref:Uncharacterized protein n=2 Tax=Gemmatimonas aurantiaca TaxID=173480 RepID=C1AAY2_GEMAT|nr:hypothetical protein [Gemmatimonas aurantiaca]BAH39388.1 hypothetical protein GAU_2346 [Gemmatimonas aurantiaca T-27]HCT56017.1 hypothetical protein [Gemmatimonas aurantiaca]